MKLILLFGLTLFSFQSYAGCATGLDDMDSEVKSFIDDFRPFWGTWRGTTQDRTRVSGEIYLDSNDRFNIKGSYGARSISGQRGRLCVTNGKISAKARGLTINLKVITKRKVEVSSPIVTEKLILTR